MKTMAPSMATRCRRPRFRAGSGSGAGPRPRAGGVAGWTEVTRVCTRWHASSIKHVIELICVGRPRGPLAEASAEYERLLSHMCRLQVREVREEPLQQGTAAEVLERERRRVQPLL